MKPTIKAGDFHLIINDREDHFESEAKLFDSLGQLVWIKSCLAKGTAGADYSKRNADTPPGLYYMGDLSVTQELEGPEIWNAYGQYFVSLIEAENNEGKFNRAGCGIHGGGSSAPDPLAPYQQLCPTHGCIRFHNKVIETELLWRLKATKDSGSKFWVSVNQF